MRVDQVRTEDYTDEKQYDQEGDDGISHGLYFSLHAKKKIRAVRFVERLSYLENLENYSNAEPPC